MGSKQIGVLKIIAGPQPKTKEVLVDKDDFNIGTTPQADLKLESQKGITTQAAIRRRANSWYIQSLNKTERFILNSKPVAAAKLNDGDKIKIGEQWFKFEILTVEEEEEVHPSTAPLKLPANVTATPALTSKPASPLFTVKDKNQLSISMVIGIGLLVVALTLFLLWMIMFVYGQWQFLRLKNAYQSGDCQHVLAQQNLPMVSNFIPGGMTIKEETLNIQQECSLVQKIQNNIETQDNAAAFQGYIDYLHTYGQSSLFSLIQNQFISFLQSKDPQTFVTDAQCTKLTDIHSVIPPFPDKSRILFSIAMACGKLFESQSNPSSAVQVYLDGFHTSPQDPLLKTVLVELSQDPLICPFMDQMLNDPVITGNTDFALKAYQTCTNSYHRSADTRSAQLMFDRLIQFLNEPQVEVKVQEMVRQDPVLCTYLVSSQALPTSTQMESLVNILIDCAQHDYLQQAYLEAYHKLDRILRDFSTTQRLVDVYNLIGQVLQAYSQQAKPQTISTKPMVMGMLNNQNHSQIKLINSSAYTLRIAFIGTQYLVVDLPACENCRSAQTTSIVSCSPSLPTREIELLSDEYQVILIQIGDNQPGLIWTDSVDLKNGRMYQWCLAP
jgi:hypothetical protein